ncbi:MAG: CPBP family intramembrane metalloprotease [Oscillospiraceae bacterium]|nr:CPBP family intramembrane metalloprotease [Oscillospiraceae bacterium]
MSDELFNNQELNPEEPKPENPAADSAAKATDYRAGFKSVSFKLGLMVIVIFCARGIGEILTSLLVPVLSDMDVTLSYILRSLISIFFLNVVPIVLTLLIFKLPPKTVGKQSYQKPKYFGRALGMFPALYSLGIMTNIITILVSRLFKDVDMNESFNTVNDFAAPNLICGIILFFQMAILAPIVEEFWFRGIVLESMRPYGNGVAIFISGLLFGLTHANFAQFFYATVLGICLGYIAVNTKSIITTTVLHAMFNSIAATLLLLLTDESVGKFLTYSTSGREAEITPAVGIYIGVLIFMTLLIIVGFFMAIAKIIKIKKYRVPKVQEELSPAKRWGIFLTSVTVIIGLILAADSFTLNFLPRTVYKWIASMFGING